MEVWNLGLEILEIDLLIAICVEVLAFEVRFNENVAKLDRQLNEILFAGSSNHWKCLCAPNISGFEI